MFTKSKRAKSLETASTPALKVLVVSEKGADLATCRELLRLPGCSVQTCSNYIEVLLRLEHENFRLAIVFEGENDPPEWEETLSQVAEAGRGTPVVFIRQAENASDLAGSLVS